MDLSGFNAADIEPQTAYQPLPAGTYKAVIVSSEDKPTKDMTGSYLKLEFEIIDGQYQGRKIFENLNLNNANQTTVEIARRSLSGICRAVGVMTPQDSSQLHNRPMEIDVKVKDDGKGYGPQNRITGYGPVGGGDVVGAPLNPASNNPNPTANAGSATPPWKR